MQGLLQHLQHFKLSLACCGLLCGIAATIYGLLSIEFTYSNYPVIVLVLTVISGLSRALFRISYMSMALGSAVTLAFAVSAFDALIVLLFILSSAYVLGLKIMQMVSPGILGHDALLIVLVGLGILGTIVGFFARWPLAYPITYFMLLTCPLIFFRDVLSGPIKQLRSGLRHFGSQPLQSSTEEILKSLLLAIALVHLCIAFLPETGADALGFHLFVPSYMSANHYWHFDHELYIWALTPMLGDWLLSLAYMLAGESAARLLNTWFVFLLAYAALKLVLWAGGSRKLGMTCAVMFLVTPLTLLESSSLFIDSVWAAFIVAAILAPLTDNNDSRYFIVAGVMAGFAMAAKFGTLAYLPAIILVSGLFYHGSKSSIPTVFAIFLGCLILTGIYPYASAWYSTGSPTFPFLTGIFQSPFPTYPVELKYPAYLSWDIPYQTVFNSRRYLEGTDGSSGFQWLLLFPLALVVSLVWSDRRSLLLLAVGVISLLITFQGMAYLRYVFPASIFILAGIFASLQHLTVLPGVFKQAVLLTIASAFCLNLLFFHSANWNYRSLPLTLLIDNDARRDFLISNAAWRPAVNLVNSLNVSRRPVALFSKTRAGTLQSDALYSNWYNSKFTRLVLSAETPEALADILNEYQTELILLQDNWFSDHFRKMIRAISDPVETYGTVTVRRLIPEYRYGKELLINPSFSGTDGWTLSAEDLYSAVTESVHVNINSTARQTVKLDPSREYVMLLQGHCLGEPDYFRFQIDWHDGNNDLIESDSSVRQCENDPRSFREFFSAPEIAVYAVVFAAGNYAEPVAVDSISFRVR